LIDYVIDMAIYLITYDLSDDKTREAVRDKYVKDQFKGIKLGRSTYAILTDAKKAATIKNQIIAEIRKANGRDQGSELVKKEIVAVVEATALAVAGGDKTKLARATLDLWTASLSPANGSAK
jgi:CRISPR/Cas system-associated endoribonuclease Cas2